MVFPFQSRGLFYIAAFICFISIILFPVGVVFVVMARRARIEITDTEFIYTMFTTKRIPFVDIVTLELLPLANARVYQSSTNMSTQVVNVWPLQITYSGNKTLKLSLNHFAHENEILDILEEKTGKLVIDKRGI